MASWRESDGSSSLPWEDEAVLELLSISTMTLATSSRAGESHAAPVFFAAEADLHLVFFSDPDSVHVRHAIEDPRMAAAIYPVVTDWTRIRGLQVVGTFAPIPSGAAWDAAWDAYRRKFPIVAELAEIVEGNWLYGLRPGWIRLVDNRRGFGYRREWALRPAG